MRRPQTRNDQPGRVILLGKLSARTLANPEKYTHDQLFKAIMTVNKALDLNCTLEGLCLTEAQYEKALQLVPEAGTD